MAKTKNKLGASGTFILNKSEPIHNWYSYLEGYSSCLIDSILNEIGVNNINSVYDPFCGTGTTCLVASKYNLDSYYSETNPFMRDVIESKINSVIKIRNDKLLLDSIKDYLRHLDNLIPNQHISNDWDGFEKFFQNDSLRTFKKLKETINKQADSDVRLVLNTLLASIVVRGSKMIRRGDLRYARDNEKKTEDLDILENYKNKIKNAIKDIEDNTILVSKPTVCIGDDSMKITKSNLVDCVITSPPYLNGTNYIRNTKLELKLSGHIAQESELALFHQKGIIAGINNVSSHKGELIPPEEAFEYIEALKPVAYDKRIPKMVGGYFHDMEIVISNLANILKDNGYFVMDIGDSQFSGVHIPTHDVLEKIATRYGFQLYETQILRERKSKNNMVLSQRLLKFRYLGDSNGR